MNATPHFDEAVEQLRDARSNLTHGRAFHELGDALFDAALAAVDGAIATLEAIQRNSQ